MNWTEVGKTVAEAASSLFSTSVLVPLPGRGAERPSPICTEGEGLISGHIAPAEKPQETQG